MALNFGKLRHRITFEQPIIDEDSPYWDEDWEIYREDVAASFNYLSGREFMAAGALQSEVVARVMIRFDEKIHSGMRLKFNGKSYDIKAVLPDNRSGKEWLTLMVSEENDGGEW